MQQLNMVPTFTSEEGVNPNPQVKPEPVEEVTEEVTGKEATDVPVEEEKETPAEPPAAEKPVEVKPLAKDTRSSASDAAISALQEERVKLLREIADLRGQRRDLKQDQLNRVDEQISELKDVHPDDAALIEKVLRAKGYVRKDEAQQMVYESVKNDEVAKFLDKYPEYKPENDSNDINWQTLQKEMSFYRIPSDPHQVGQLLERAHRAISIIRTPSGRSTTQKARQIEVAGAGAGGVQRPSSSGKTFDPLKKAALLQGGWSEEEIKNMEKKLE